MWHTPDPVPGVEYAVMSKTGVTPELLALRARSEKSSHLQKVFYVTVC